MLNLHTKHVISIYFFYRILYKESKFRETVKSVIRQKRERTFPMLSRPDDVFNVSIQAGGHSCKETPTLYISNSGLML